MKEKSFGGTSTVLQNSHYTSRAVRHEKATQSSQGNAVLVGERYIVKAGTIWPLNDATAQGIVAHDYDVTEKGANMAIITHGTVKLGSLPAAPVTAASTALKSIVFVGE